MPTPSRSTKCDASRDNASGRVNDFSFVRSVHEVDVVHGLARPWSLVRLFDSGYRRSRCSNAVRSPSSGSDLSADADRAVRPSMARHATWPTCLAVLAARRAPVGRSAVRCLVRRRRSVASPTPVARRQTRSRAMDRTDVKARRPSAVASTFPTAAARTPNAALLRSARRALPHPPARRISRPLVATHRRCSCATSSPTARTRPTTNVARSRRAARR
jgi:hypothetical protein